MKLVELSIREFENFAYNHPLRSYAQTVNYAKVMGEMGFSYDYIGYKDDIDNIIAASLILTKKLRFNKYAYAPKGFLVDYYNTDLLKEFVQEIVQYYDKKGCAFIKINPEIIIGEINSKRNFAANYNQNVKIIDDLKSMGFKRRREIKPLDFIFPRISPYINLKTFDINSLDDDVKDTLDTGTKSGLVLEEAFNKDINMLFDYIKDNTNMSINFFRNVVNIFQGNTGPNAELLLLKVDYEACLVEMQRAYDRELEHNNECNEKIQSDNSDAMLNEKMQSDRDLISIKASVVQATNNLKKQKYEYIAAALVIKFENRVSIVAAGADNKFISFNPMIYLYYSLTERFKNDYDFLDLNGLANSYSDLSPFYRYNKDKIDLNPDIYEFIGEFDYIIDNNKFKRIQSAGLLSEEFLPSYKINEE